MTVVAKTNAVAITIVLIIDASFQGHVLLSGEVAARFNTGPIAGAYSTFL
jgi:hypothetical protein